MTEKEKAAQVLRYMEDELDTTTIVNLLCPYVKDEDLAGLFDSLVKSGRIHPDGYCNL